MTDGDRPPVHVEFLGIDFPDRLIASQPLAREFLRRERLEVRGELGRERFVNIDEIDLVEGEARRARALWAARRPAP